MSTTLDELREIICDIDLSHVKNVLEQNDTGFYHVANEAELEYRRLLLLTAVHPEEVIEIGGMVAVMAQAAQQTREFDTICLSMFGGHAAPKWRFRKSTAPGSVTAERYHALFGESLPGTWVTGRAMSSDPTPGP